MKKIISILFIGMIFLAPLIILPLTIDYYNPPKALFVQLMAIFCLTLWLFRGISTKKFEIIDTALYTPLLLFIIITGFSILAAANKYFALTDYFQILVYITVFFICVNVIDKKGAVKVAQFALFSGVLCAIYAIFQYLGADFIKYTGISFPDWRFKLYSSFGNPDFVANYLILTFPLGVAFFASTNNLFKKIAAFLMVLIIYTALLLTFSIGAFLGLIGGTIFTAYLFIREFIGFVNPLPCQEQIKYACRRVVFLLVTLALISLFILPALLVQAKNSFVWQHGWDNRVILYKSALRMAKAEPVLGVGIGNFKIKFPKYRGDWLRQRQEYVDSALLDTEKDKNVVSDFIQVLAETGILGFIAFLIVLITILKAGVSLFRKVPDDRNKLFILGLLGGISGFLAHSLFSFPFHVVPNALLFWTLVALLFTQIKERNVFPIALELPVLKKRILEGGVVLLLIISCAWPLRLYMSEVFLKRALEDNKQGSVDAAVKEARAAVACDSNSSAIIFIGNYASLAGDSKTAIISFEKALENSDEIQLHTALAEFYHKDHLPQDSINEYKNAILLNPFSPQLHLRLAELYKENKMRNAAEAECQFLMMYNKKDEDIQKHVAKIMQDIFEEQFFSSYSYGQIQPIK